MVTKEQAQASQQREAEKQKVNDAETAKIKQNIQDSLTGANRGYNYSDTSGRISHGADPSKITESNPTGAWNNEAQVKQREAEQLAQKQARQRREAQNLQNQNKSRPELIGSKQSIYDNRGYEYEDSTDDNYIHGADPKKITEDNPTGFYIKDKMTGESYDVTRKDAKDFGQYQSKDDKTPLRDIEINEPAKFDNFQGPNNLIPVEKITYNDPFTDSLIKQYGFETAKKIIADRNEVIEWNNKTIEKYNEQIKQENEKAVNDFVSEGKKFGYKEYKITDNGTTNRFSIDDTFPILNASSNADIRFVPTEKMRQDKLDSLQSRRDFLNFGKQQGFTEYKVTTDGINQRFSVNDPSGIKNAKETSTFTLVPNVETRAKKLEQIKQTREFINFAVANKEKYKGIGVDNKIILLDNPKNIAQNLRNEQKLNPDANVRLLRTQEQKQKDRESFEQLKSTVKTFKQNEYQFFSIVGPRDENDLREGKVVPVSGGVREILKFGNVAEITPIDYPDRERRLYENNSLVFTPKVYEGNNPFQKLSTDFGNIAGQAKVDALNFISSERIKTERQTENNQPTNKVERFGLLLKGYSLAFGASIANLGTTISNLDKNSYQKNDVKQNELLYSGKLDTASEIISAPVSSFEEIQKDKPKETVSKIDAPEKSISRKFNSSPENREKVINFASDVDTWRKATGQKLVTIGENFAKSPIEAKGADIVFGVATFVSPTNIAKGIPLRYTSTPIVTAKGTETLTRTLRFGYNEGKLLGGQYPQSGKIFIGSQQPQFSGIKKMVGTESRNSFDVNEQGAFSIRQKADIKPLIEYGEKIGIYKPFEFIETQKLGDTIHNIGVNKKEIFKNLVKKDVDVKATEQDFTYENPVSGLDETRIKGYETNKLFTDLQKSNELGAKGGSDIFNQYKTAIQRKIGDLDFDILKNREKVIDKIMNSNIMREGFSLQRRGSNIVTGETDYSNPIYNNILVKNDEMLHGTDKTSAKNISKFGIKYDVDNRGVGFFTTQNVNLATRFTGKKPTLINTTVNWDNVLRFDKLSKNEQKELTKGVGKSKNYDLFQDRGIELAREKGKSAFYKPYKSNNPKAKVYELITFDKGVLEFKEFVKPTGYGIKKGTEQDFLNLLTESDIKNELSGNKSGKFFGYESLGGIIKQKLTIKNAKGDITGTNILETKDIVQQLQNLGMSNSQMLGKKSLQNYKGDASKFEPIFKDYDVRFGFSTLGRLDKDTVSLHFFGLKFSAEGAWKAGNKPLAKEIGERMNYMYFKHKEWGFDWKNEIAELRKKGPVKVRDNYSKIDSLKEFAGKQGGKFEQGAYASSSFSRINESKNKDSVLSFKSPKSTFSFSSKFIASVQSLSTKSSVKSLSALSPKSPSVKSLSSLSSKSPSVKSLSSLSPKSPSVKSLSSLSPKSPSVKSLSSLSPKSPSVKSPSIKTPSIKSPSIKSPSIKSPSIKSPSIKSPSIKSPSIKSPSIKSPSIKSPSLNSPLIKSPTLMPPKILIPMMKFGFGPKRSYIDKRKPSITFRWAVSNPVFKKFSISEGKKGKTIEW